MHSLYYHCYFGSLAPELSFGPIRITKAYSLLRITDTTYLEGELVLEYRLDNSIIFSISFSIVPGIMLGLREKQVVFIGGCQGSANSSNQIRFSAKSHHEIYPPTILIIALQSLGRALRISTLVGISASNHCLAQTCSNFLDHLSTYDLLWKINGAAFNRKFYSFSTIPYEKDLGLITRTHRRRAKIRRQFKSQIRNKIIYAIFQSIPFKTDESKKSFLKLNLERVFGLGTSIPRTRGVSESIIFASKEEVPKNVG